MSRTGFNAAFPQAVQPPHQMPVYFEFPHVRPDRGMAFGHPVVPSVFLPPMAPTALFQLDPQQSIYLSRSGPNQMPAGPFNASPAGPLIYGQQYGLQQQAIPPMAAMLHNHPVLSQRTAELPRRENKAIPIKDPVTLREIVLTPPARQTRTATPSVLFSDKPLMPVMHQPPPPISNEGPLISTSEVGFEPPPPTVVTTTIKPSVKSIFRDGQPVAQKVDSQESEKNDLLLGVIDLFRARERNRSSAASPTKEPVVEEKTSSQRASKPVSPVKPVEQDTLDNVIGPKFMGLLAPSNDFSLAYEKREVKQEESQWLPVGMQASEDEEEFMEDFAEEDQAPVTEQVVVPSTTETSASKAAADEVPSKRLSREFLMSCYANPATRIKPESMSDSSVVLNKPIENLLDVLKKAIITPGEAQERAGRGWYGLSRNDMGKSYARPQEVQLHKAQDPYFVKTSSDLSDIELKTRQFRGLMNKITETNCDRIISKMADLDLNKEELYRPILAVIFDKAIQEPNYCHLYAKVCEFLTKILRLSKVREDGGTEKVTFKQILVGQVQESFQKRLTDVEAYTKVENELAVTTSDVTKKRLREEMDEIVRDVKRKYMGNMKFIGQLFKLDVFNMKLIEFCIEILFEKNIVEWQYESLCNLMFVIGSMLDENNPKFVDNILAKMRTLMPSVSDNRIRFMFMDVFDMRANGWKSRKPGDKEPTSAIKSSRPQLSSRLSGMGSSQQQRYQYVGAGSQRRDSPERRTLSFDKPELFDRMEHARSSKAGSMQKTKQPVAAAKPPAKPAPPPATRAPRQEPPQESKVVPKESKMDKLKKLLEVKGFYKFEDLEKTMSQINEIMEKDWKLWKTLLPMMYEAILGYDEESCVRFGRLMFTALHNGTLAEQDLLDSVKLMWANADDLKLDVPFFFPLMGATLTDVLNHKYPDSIKLLPRLYEPITKKPGAGKAIGRMLELACKQFSNENVKRQIDQCGFDLKKYCTQEELHTLLETKVIAMLLTSEMFLSELYDILVSTLAKEEISNEAIIEEIENKYKNKEYKTPKVMQPVMHALLDVCVEIGPNNEIKELHSDIIDRRSPVLLSFAPNEEYEAEAINVICNYVRLKEIPFGLLAELFGVVREMDLVSDESFLLWRQQNMRASESSNSSSGTLILATKKFFEWLDGTRLIGDEREDSPDISS